MIKLIASDMDGSLLDDKDKLPGEFFDILDRLILKGVKFAAASGRSYCTLYDDFSPRSEDISYIGDNGAFVVDNGEIIHADLMSKEDIVDIVNASKQVKDIQLILCGRKGAHILPYSKWFIEEIEKYYSDSFIEKDLCLVDDDIFKIGVCDMGGAEKNSYPFFKEKFKDRLNVTISGFVWVDLMKKGSSKGSGLKALQEKLNILPEETMVFGDYNNDIEMLKNAKYSFVMENASDEIKKYGNFIAKSNKEHGVIQAIKEYVLKD